MATIKLHVLTNSELSEWRRCHARWGFQYVELLRPLVNALPLTWGDLLHCGAEAGWRAAWEELELSTDARLQRAHAAAPVAIAERAKQKIQETQDTTFPDGVDADRICAETEEAARVATWSAGHYFSCARTDLSMVPLLIEASYQLSVPTARGVGGILKAAGKIDLVLWDRELGRIVVQDHKGTGSDVHSIERRVELDTQLVGYVGAVKELMRGLTRQNAIGDPRLGIHPHLHTTPAAAEAAVKGFAELQSATVGAIAYNVVRRKMPGAPALNLLKKGQCTNEHHRHLLAEQEGDGEPRGEVSVQAIDTLPQVYKEALERQIVERELLATEKQLALMQRLRDRGDTFFAQIEYFKGDDAIERWRKELWVEAKRMRAAERDPSLRTRNPLACTLPQSPACPYSTVCLTPGDPVALANFRKANTKHEELDHGNSDADAVEEEGF